MSLDYNFFKSATTAANTGKGTNTPNTSFSSFRLFAQSINTALRNDFANKEKQKEELKEQFNDRVVNAKSAELDSVYNTVVKGKQNMLINVVDKLVGNVRKAYERFAMLPPDPIKIMKIEKAESRMDTMSDTELLLLIKDAANNYQESALLHSIATKHGKDYNIPFEPAQAEENLTALQALIKEQIIPNIGKDRFESLDMATFFNYDENKPVYGKINQLAQYFDNLPIAVKDDEPIPELTQKENLESRLLAARQRCWTNNAKSLWEEGLDIGFNIQKNGLKTENIKKAEKFISIVDELFPEEESNGDNKE